MHYQSVVRPSQSSNATLILLHGLGSDEQDMLGLAGLIDPRIEVVCIRGPLSYGPGFAWFNIEWTANGINVDEDEYWEAIGNLAHELVTLGKSRLIIGGFSQGAMMALGIATKFPHLASDCVLLSGRGIENPCTNFVGHIFQAHGRFDEVIPVSEAHSLSADLTNLGDRYEYHEYPMGHSVCEQEIDHLNLWLNKTLDLK